MVFVMEYDIRFKSHLIVEPVSLEFLNVRIRHRYHSSILLMHQLSRWFAWRICVIDIVIDIITSDIVLVLASAEGRLFFGYLEKSDR